MVKRTNYRIVISDLELQARIGLFEHEHNNSQRLRLSLTMDICASSLQEPSTGQTTTRDFICYDRLVSEIEREIVKEHVALLEDLADRIAELCFSRTQTHQGQAPKVESVWLRLEKPDALAQTQNVGIEMHYTQDSQ